MRETTRKKRRRRKEEGEKIILHITKDSKPSRLNEHASQIYMAHDV